MSLDDYKVVLYRNQHVSGLIAEEYLEKGLSMPVDTTAIVNA